jgi:hypothetical protein
MALADPSTVSVEALRAHGVADAALETCVVIEFGNPASAFDAMLPGEYFVGERRFDWTQLPRELC